MAISRAIADDIQAHDGEIQYRQTVLGIEVLDGRAVAVTTKKGLRIEADVVVSNANSPDTLLKMVGAEHLPAGYVSQVATDKPSMSNLVVYLGLDRDLTDEGWGHHEYYEVNTYDLEADYEDAKAGRFDKTSMVITHYTHADRTAAPEGHSILSLFAIAPWDHADQWGTGGDLDGYSDNPAYIEAKERAADQLIDRAAQLVPGLKDMIIHKEIGTPLTNWRYSLNPGGAIYGSEQTVDNMYLERLDRRTPIDNLFLAGAWTFGGGQSAALLSGRATARTVQAFLDETTDPDPPITSEGPPMEDTTPDQTPPNIDLALVAVETGREVPLLEIGIPSVLVFHNQDTAETARTTIEAVREIYPDATDLMVASVVALDNVPRLFRKIAERAMKTAFEQASAALPKNKDPSDYVIILPDWDGAASTAMGFDNLGQTPGVAVLDAAGTLIGTDQSPDLPTKAIELLEERH